MPKFEACELSRKDFVENHHVFKSQHLCRKDLVLGMPTGVDAGFVRHMHIGVALTSLSWECGGCDRKLLQSPRARNNSSGNPRQTL